MAEQLKSTQLQTQLLQHIAEYVKGKGSIMSQTIPETNASTLKAALMELLAHSMRDLFYEPECELFFQAWEIRQQVLSRITTKSPFCGEKCPTILFYIYWRKINVSFSSSKYNLQKTKKIQVNYKIMLLSKLNYIQKNCKEITIEHKYF